MVENRKKFAKGDIIFFSVLGTLIMLMFLDVIVNPIEYILDKVTDNDPETTTNSDNVGTSDTYDISYGLKLYEIVITEFTDL